MGNGACVYSKEVLLSRGDKHYRGQQSVEEAKKKYLEQATPCPFCRRQAEQLSWTYLVLPKWAWETLGEKAGWITVCNRCGLQIDFFADTT